MKEFPQYHSVQSPVTVLKLVGYKTGTRTKRDFQQKWAFDPSYARWNCFLISSLYGGNAT
jgi:hypothetical protein